MRFLVPLVAALVPLLITPGWLSTFDVTPKVAVLLFGMALILLYPANHWGDIRALWRASAGRSFLSLLAVSWVACALATAFSSNRALSLHGAIWRRFGLLSTTGVLLFAVLAAAWLAAERTNVLITLRFCAAAGGLASLYGIAQYFGWDPLLPAQAYHVGEGAFTIVRPPGTLGHADYFASWLVIVVFFALALRQMELKGWWRTAAAIIAALAIVAIFLSGTRAAILGLAAGAILYTARTRTRLTGRVVTLALTAACVAALFYYSPLGEKMRARVSWSIEDVRGGARLLLWRDSAAMATHRLFAGFGPETFATEFPRFESVELASAYPDFYNESPHNIFLDALTGEGLLGFASIAGLCLLGLWLIPKTWAALAAGLVAAICCQQFSVLILPTALYFYLLLAMVVVTAIPKTAAAERKHGAYWLIPIHAIVALPLVLYSVHLLIADHAFEQARQDIASGNAPAAAARYRSALSWNPPGAGFDLDYSREMAQLANRTPVFAARLQARQQALEAGVRATTTAIDRQNAWYNLALLFAAENDPISVERSLRNAIAWAPNWFKPHWTLAQLLEITGRHTEAVAEAKKAVACDGGHDPEVSATLQRLLQQQDSAPK